MQDMMHCLNPSVLERQRFHLQQQQEMIINNFSIENFLSLQSEGLGGGEGWPSLTSTPQYAIDSKQQEELLTSPTTTTTTSNSASSLQAGKEKTTAGSSSRKRKPPIVAGDDEEKRMKGGQGNEGEKRKGKREDSGNDSKDYIHVRARRGQATDSHSLAERVRRERISERMKYLQGLVPGCNRITGKAGMLEEIINYVQSLQRQVEFLSMKLAAVNPRLDFNMEALITKEMNMQCNSNISSVRISPEMVDPSFLQFNSLQQAVASCDLDMAVSPVELALRKTISALAPAPEPFLDSCFNVQRNSAGWDNELHNLYGQASPFHSLQGNILSNNMKTEMLASIRLFMEEKLIYANAKADDSLQST